MDDFAYPRMGIYEREHRKFQAWFKDYPEKPARYSAPDLSLDDAKDWLEAQKPKLETTTKQASFGIVQNAQGNIFQAYIIHSNGKTMETFTSTYDAGLAAKVLQIEVAKRKFAGLLPTDFKLTLPTAYPFPIADWLDAEMEVNQ